MRNKPPFNGLAILEGASLDKNALIFFSKGHLSYDEANSIHDIYESILKIF